MKILIMKFRHIGDVLLTSPMADALATLPEPPKVTFLVKAGTEQMLSGHAHIDQVLVWPEPEPGEGRWAYLQREIRFMYQLRQQQFDISINSTEGDRGLFIGWLSGAKRRIGYLKDATREKWWRKRLLTDPQPSRPGSYHAVLRNLDLLKPLVTPKTINVSLHYTPLDEMQVLDRLKQAGWDGAQSIVHVHPVSRWFFKCWRDDLMARTIDQLQQKHGHQVVLTCAPEPKELEKLHSIIQRCQTKPFNLGGQLTLKQTAALSAMAKFFLGVDSAPMHIAAAVNTPVIALFGPSGSFDWGPWPNGWTSVTENPYPKRNGHQTAGKHRVFQQHWECVPCGQAGCENSGVSRCLQELTLSEL